MNDDRYNPLTDTYYGFDRREHVNASGDTKLYDNEKGLYNPLTDIYNESEEDLTTEQRNRFNEAEINKAIASKKRAIEKLDDADIKSFSYDDAIARIERQNKYQSDLYNQIIEENLNAEKLRESTYLKGVAINEAKKRYKSKSVFYKIFHKKIDNFKKGIGYYNAEKMSLEQINNLYGGRTR